MTRLPYRAWLLVIVLAAIATSAVSPFDRLDWALEHLPTAAVLSFLIWYERRPGGSPLSNTSCTLLFVMLLLHVLGAHHLYSRVPYDDWFASAFGFRPSKWCGSPRNHYDRFVHLCFGLCATLPIAEMLRRHATTSAVWATTVAVVFVAAISKVYELAEWLLAVFMSPDAAENYNGQQGDPFDAQKDMALALAGSLAAVPFVAKTLGGRAARRSPSHTPTAEYAQRDATQLPLP